MKKGSGKTITGKREWGGGEREWKCENQQEKEKEVLNVLLIHWHQVIQNGVFIKP